FGSIVFTLISRGVSEDYILEKMLAGEMKPEVLFVNEIEKAREFIRLAGPALDITYSLKDKSEYNLTHFASENNLENLLVQLINSKASLEHRSSIGTPIEIAAENGFTTIVEKLLSASHPSFGNEAINRALKGGHFNLASQLLDAGLKPGNYSHLISLDFKKNSYSNSIKRYLVSGSILDRGYINSPAKRLIEEGRGAERIESTGNNVMFTYLLLPHFSESSYNSSNRKYLSNVAWKVWSNWNLVGDEFLVNKMDQSLLSYALHSYKSPGIKVLNYWNIISSSRLRSLWGQVDKLGMVPMHYAFMTKSGQPSKSEVKKMISYGADVNHINNMNESILHMICRFGNYKMAKYLIKGPFIGSRPRFDYKRLINLTNLKAESPLVLAKRSGNKSLISLLKAYGATK
ncbi:MAG: ankyrin repeat domain-containing protein, partial [Bacteriovoracaceae bacterium]|nr:ankyrin repeat domain-containing protein [Bacteriovoracaceae bacterium]